jgi:hypothetical protein
MPRPAVKLSALREIGWEVWDPIGIRDLVSDDYAEGPADEYDRYLLVAFGMAQSGKSESEITAYLGDLASRHMGLGPSIDGGEAERKTTERLTCLAKSLT